MKFILSVLSLSVPASAAPAPSWIYCHVSERGTGPIGALRFETAKGGRLELEGQAPIPLRLEEVTVRTLLFRTPDGAQAYSILFSEELASWRQVYYGDLGLQSGRGERMRLRPLGSLTCQIRH